MSVGGSIRHGLLCRVRWAMRCFVVSAQATNATGNTMSGTIWSEKLKRKRQTTSATAKAISAGTRAMAEGCIGREWHPTNARTPGAAAPGALVDALIVPLGAESMNTSQSGPAVSGVVVTTSPCAAAGGRRLPGPVQGPVPGPHRVRPARLPDWCDRAASIRWPRPDRTSSSTCAGCRRSAATSHRRCPAASRWSPASTAPASSTASWSTHRPSTSAARTCPPSRRPWD